MTRDLCGGMSPSANLGLIDVALAGQDGTIAVPGAGGAGQTPGGTGVPGGGAAPPAGGGGFDMFTILMLVLVMFVLMAVMTGRREKKERKKKEELLASIGKNDRVQTLGGMLGTVVEVKEDEVRLRVDETTKTSIWFSKGAIQQVVRKAGGADRPAETAEAGAAT